MEYYSKCKSDTFELGKEFGKKAQKGDVFCIIGDLGAGKTVFSQGFASGLGVQEQVTSPTFTLVNEYMGRLPLYHFDAYRLNTDADSICFDFDEYFDYCGVCLIEWADNVPGAIPAHAFFLVIEIVNENERKISVHSAKKSVAP